jgi:predicted transcriptional regulator
MTVANKKGSISKDGQSASKKPTIVRLDPVLKKKLKHIGIEQDKSLNAIIEEALVDYLRRYEKP